MGAAKSRSSFTDNEEIDKNMEEQSKPNVVNLQNIQARIDKVNVEGLVRTKDDIIKRTISDLFTAKTFEDVIKQVHIVRKRLEGLECFRTIAVNIDTSTGPKASENGYEITFKVHELKRIKGGVNTIVGNDNEGSLVITAQAPNFLGRAEKVHAEYSYGSRQTRTFNFGFYMPFIFNYNSAFSTNIFQSKMEWPSSGYKLIQRGSVIDFSFFSLNKVKHNVQWEGSWRELGVVNRFSSFKVREDSGHSLKSSIRHILSLDYRDSPVFPNYGTLLQLTSELAGLGGNVGFVKNEILLQQNYEVLPETVLQGAFAGGWMKAIDSNKEVFICDKFFLGGPMSLRGFENRGVGPFSDGNYIGGMIYWSGALHLYSPLPFKPRVGGFGEYIRTHIFVNAGNLGNFNTNKENWLHDLISSSRMAYGAGIVIRLGLMARIELNYVIPVYFHDTDRIISKGVQFGIGLNFL